MLDCCCLNGFHPIKTKEEKMNTRLQKPLSILVTLLLISVNLAFSGLQAMPTTSSRAQAEQPARREPAGMPDDLMSAFLAATSQPFEASAEGYQARSGGMDFNLDASGLQASGEGFTWSLALSGFGRGEQIAPVSEPRIAQAGGYLEYQRGALTEWYRNTALGIEQGFTLYQAPGGAGPLILELDLLTGSEDLAVTADVSGGGLSFDLPTGQALRYDHWRAWDADGASLDAHLGYTGEQVIIELNDQSATYPITIDPLIYLEQKVTASDGATRTHFGYSVALSGDTALVGAVDADYSPTYQGSVYVFICDGTTWTQQAQLATADGANMDYFGYSVALSGDTALVGALGSHYDPGSAYVFTRSESVWTQQAQLTTTDPAEVDYFGGSAALSGDTALVGAFMDDVGANIDQGSVYVFSRSGTTWTQETKLIATNGAAEDLFGMSVALSGNTALVGATQADVGTNSNQGSVYVFTRSGTSWTQQAQLTVADGSPYDWFGGPVALSGDTVLVGASGDDVGANGDQGSAYVFTGSGAAWNLQAKLTAADGEVEDYFGSSVSLSGDTALIGAFLDDVGINHDQGSAYVFTRSRSTWTQQKKLTAGDGASNDRFGPPVALTGDTALVGARWKPYYDYGGIDEQGAAYFYELTFLNNIFYLPVVSRSAP
jgi:virulence-associated protein VapD